MDLELNADQQALRDACRAVLNRLAGPTRARELWSSDACDRELLATLDEAGFLGLATEPEAGPLEAALVTEWAAEAAAWAPVGARTLVAPALPLDSVPPALAVADAEDAAMNGEILVPYGCAVDLLVLVEGEEAVALPAGDWSATPVSTRCGSPLAAVKDRRRGTGLGLGSGVTARRWWRIAIAAEIVGAVSAALALVLSHLRQREQFGRPLASFQALQHRLAELYVSLEGARWLTREAADKGAPGELAAATATGAASLARQAEQELHQMTGALGLATEYDLHLWTGRLQALRLVAGGQAAHAAELAEQHRARVAARPVGSRLETLTLGSSDVGSAPRQEQVSAQRVTVPETRGDHNGET